MAKSIVEQAISKVTAIIDALYESYKKNVGRFKKEGDENVAPCLYHN